MDGSLPVLQTQIEMRGVVGERLKELQSVLFLALMPEGFYCRDTATPDR